jgi:hypothetical protein
VTLLVLIWNLPLLPVYLYAFDSRSDPHDLCGLNELQADRLNAPRLDLLLHVLVDLIGLLNSVDLDDTPLRLELVDNGHAGVDEGLEALLDRLDVVVGTTRGLATVQETLEHDLLGRVEEEGELGGDDGALESVGLIELAGEACDVSASQASLVAQGTTYRR